MAPSPNMHFQQQQPAFMVQTPAYFQTYSHPDQILHSSSYQKYQAQQQQETLTQTQIIAPTPLAQNHHLNTSQRFYDSSAQSSRATTPEHKIYTQPSSAIGSPYDSEDDLDDALPRNEPLFLNFSQDLSPSGELRGLVLHPGSVSAKSKSGTCTPSTGVYKPLGVNILNRHSVDSKTALDRLKKRRENHNFVERRRRDHINSTIYELADQLPPHLRQHGNKINKGSVLRGCVDTLKHFNETTASRNARIDQLQTLLSAHNIPIPASPRSSPDTSM